MATGSSKTRSALLVPGSSMKLHPDGLWRSVKNWYKKAPDRSHLTLASKRYLDASYVPDVDLDDD